MTGTEDSTENTLHDDDITRIKIAGIVGVAVGLGLTLYGLLSGSLLFVVAGGIAAIGTAVSAEDAIDAGVDRDE